MAQKNKENIPFKNESTLDSKSSRIGRGPCWIRNLASIISHIFQLQSPKGQNQSVIVQFLSFPSVH